MVLAAVEEAGVGVAVAVEATTEALEERTAKAVDIVVGTREGPKAVEDAATLIVEKNVLRTSKTSTIFPAWIKLLQPSELGRIDPVPGRANNSWSALIGWTLASWAVGQFSEERID